MRKSQSVLRVAGAAFLLVGLAVSAPAEELEPGSAEAIGYGGLVANDGGNGTVGGGIGYAIGRRLLFVGEGGYIFGESSSFGGVKASGSGLEFGAGVHYLFPLANDKLTPYVLGGLAVMRASASVTGMGLSGSVSDTSIGVGLGGGLRYRLGENWGLRPEVKFVVGDGTYTRLSVGLYYQF